jgi:hypothetical protein
VLPSLHFAGECDCPLSSRCSRRWRGTVSSRAHEGRSAVSGYELAREQRRITAVEILRAAGTADETDRTPFPQSALLNNVVMPAVEQAERTFATALARINIEDLAHSAAALPAQEPDRADSILTEPGSVRQSR